MDYEDMTVEQLEIVNQDLMARKEAIREQQRELTAVMDRKMAEAEARRKVKSLTDVEKEVLAQVLRAEGVKSEEAVGVPGS